MKGEHHMKYEVIYTYTKTGSDFIEANSVDEAKHKWEDMGYDAELFIIRDENGNEVVYD